VITYEYGLSSMRCDAMRGAECAKAVGNVMGNYHPHGDSARYDTLVRMAQLFALRYPLVTPSAAVLDKSPGRQRVMIFPVVVVLPISVGVHWQTTAPISTSRGE